MPGRCPSCGGELELRLGQTECTQCGARVLRHDAANAPPRDPSAAPWDPPSQFAAIQPPKADDASPDAVSTVQRMGLYSGGMYRPRMHELSNPRLDVEKWAFLIAYFLGSAFTTCAFAVARGESLTEGGVFFAVFFIALVSTLPPCVVLFWRSASLKNGCLLVNFVMLCVSGWRIYEAIGASQSALVVGLSVQCALFAWLGWILLRDNELE